jgi:hypothetical protein
MPVAGMSALPGNEVVSANIQGERERATEKTAGRRDGAFSRNGALLQLNPALGLSYQVFILVWLLSGDTLYR